jgi:hypothetical protein
MNSVAAVCDRRKYPEGRASARPSDSATVVDRRYRV